MDLGWREVTMDLGWDGSGMENSGYGSGMENSGDGSGMENSRDGSGMESSGGTVSQQTWGRRGNANNSQADLHSCQVCHWAFHIPAEQIFLMFLLHLRK